MSARLARLVRVPLVHFLALGAVLLFAVDRFVPPSVVVRASDLDAVRTQWIRETGREPSQAELAASRRRAIDEELMVREALRLRFDTRDPVVRERLLRNLEFLDGRAGGDAEARLDDARRLDMAARDPVTRRRLVQLMEARFANEQPMTEAEVAAFVQKHADRYAEPERRAFRQLFFSRDARGEHARADAQAALARLSAGEAVAGDAFLAGDDFPPMDARTLASRFGESFARAVSQAEAGRWAGPIESAWGEHLVLVERVEPTAAPDLASLGSRAAWAALDERDQDSVRAGIAALRTRWRVEVAPGPVARTKSG